MKRALILMADGVEDVEAVAPIDVLNRVNVEVTVASLEPGPVRAAYGTTIIADTTIAEVTGEYDAVIVPGGKKNAQALAEDDRVRELVREYFNRGKLVAAICAAPSHVLAESAGILAGRRACGDPGFNDMLSGCGAVLSGEDVTVDGNLVTATGPGSALRFALTLASLLAGGEAARPFAQKWGITPAA